MDVHPTKNVSIGIDPYPCDDMGIGVVDGRVLVISWD
jgi:hypothetical protein